MVNGKIIQKEKDIEVIVETVATGFSLIIHNIYGSRIFESFLKVGYTIGSMGVKLKYPTRP